jgi:hypothetical protein
VGGKLIIFAFEAWQFFRWRDQTAKFTPSQLFVVHNDDGLSPRSVINQASKL